MRFLLLLVVLFPIYLSAQIHQELDGKFLLAETKQVGQFFRRFNGEEDFKGKRLAKSDTLLHHPQLRELYIANTFDKFNLNMHDTVKKAFVEQVVWENKQMLNLRSGNWFAQVDAMFEYKGRLEQGILFLALEKENKGYAWVLSNVYFYPFVKMFNNDEDKWQVNDIGQIKKYIHPKSHELHFINLTSALNQTDAIEDYIETDHRPDFLTLFIFEMKRKELVLKSINKVRFHFFQIEDWYFELTEIRRNSKNSGWLISDIAHVSDEEKSILKEYIFMRGNNLVSQ